MTAPQNKERLTVQVVRLSSGSCLLTWSSAWSKSISSASVYWVSLLSSATARRVLQRTSRQGDNSMKRRGTSPDAPALLRASRDGIQSSTSCWGGPTIDVKNIPPTDVTIRRPAVGIQVAQHCTHRNWPREGIEIWNTAANNICYRPGVNELSDCRNPVRRFP